jgi:hypothetical protein
MWSGVHPTKFSDEFLRVVIFVSAQRHALPAGSASAMSSAASLSALPVASVRKVCIKSPLRFAINIRPM